MLSATRPHTLGDQSGTSTLVDALLQASTHRPDHDAVVEGSTRLSYADLREQAERFGAGLRGLGVRPGDAVLIQLPNWWETVVAAWGTWLAGGVVLPVVPIYRAHELGFIVDQIQPAAVVTAASYRGYDHAAALRTLLDERTSTAAVVSVRGKADGAVTFEETLVADPREDTDPPRSPDDIALVLYTSGTTSSPKGVLHSHRTLLAEAASIVTACRLANDDRVFMPSPLSHITGLSYAVVMPAVLGAAAVLLDRWDPVAAVDLVEEEGCTFTVSATPFLRALTDTYVDRRVRCSTLHTFVCGGADIPPDLVRLAHEVMGTAVLRTYGSTEMPTLAMADPLLDLDDQADHEGLVIGSNEMALRRTDGVDELVCRGPELFLGYVDPRLNDDAFTDDGYFRTGDTATITDGALRITGRIKDVINRGGEKYSASEVEWVLLGHPDVTEVAIVGYPDVRLGEKACAYVVPRAEAVPTLEELRHHLLAAGLAVQKAPERLEIVSELPRTASGKIQKFVLRQRLHSAAVPDGAESTR